MPEKQPKRARQHHVLPQFYLRAWANADGGVAMLARDGKQVTTGTAALGVEKDFYTVTAPNGEKVSVVEEELLREWDGRGSAIHTRLLDDDFPLNDEDRMKFGLFVGLQWLRGRAARRVGIELRDTMLKLLIRLGLDRDRIDEALDSHPGKPPGPLPGAGPGVKVPDLSGLPEEAKQVLRDTDAYMFETPREELVKHMIEGVPDAAAHFIEADWYLLRFEGKPLFTSDEPISLYREPSPANAFLGLGPANADIIDFPLSPSRCLAMSKTQPLGPERILDLPASAADELNHLTVYGRWQQLFRHPDGTPFPSDIPPLPEQFVEEVG